MNSGEFQQTVQAVANYLRFCREIGIKEIPVQRVQKEKTDKKQSAVLPSQISSETSSVQTLSQIRKELGDCTRCKLFETRNSIVFGEGNPNAKLMFIGEGPGRDEDRQGRPFVGRAGQLLTKIIEAMKLKRNDVYICNVVKCRPPQNRNPEPDEVASCEPFLMKQIKSVNPEVIVCLGSVAAGLMLKIDKFRMGNIRGTFREYGDAKLMVTYHPAALLRNSSFKKPVWEDMQLVMKELGISVNG